MVWKQFKLQEVQSKKVHLTVEYIEVIEFSYFIMHVAFALKQVYFSP